MNETDWLTVDLIRRIRVQSARGVDDVRIANEIESITGRRPSPEDIQMAARPPAVARDSKSGKGGAGGRRRAPVRARMRRPARSQSGESLSGERLAQLLRDYGERGDMTVRQIEAEYGLSHGHAFHIARRHGVCGAPRGTRIHTPEERLRLLDEGRRRAAAGEPIKPLARELRINVNSLRRHIAAATDGHCKDGGAAL